MTRLAAVSPPKPDDESPVRVLVVDDEEPMRRMLARVLGARGFVVTTEDGGEQALARIEAEEPDVLLVDVMMPRMSGLQVLERVKADHPRVEVVLMTAFADVEVAVNALRAGAYHFLTKPFQSNDVVAVTVAKAAEHRRLSDRARRLEERLEAQERLGELIGASPGMLELYRLVEGVAKATSTVLVLGESGTGKELVARAIHALSARASKPLVPVNCAAIPRELVESELFGHLRGAFTGAQSARAGLFESAHGGTIFLDEVGDLPLPVQVSLLRTLQEGEIKPVGADKVKVVDVRVIAATNVDLEAKIAGGEFRRDLYYRLNVIRAHVPPLRERGEDVLLLATHFVRKLARRMERPEKPLSPGAMRALRGYAWPGNVRELEHAIERAFVLSRGESIEAADLPSEVRSGAPSGSSASSTSSADSTPRPAQPVPAPPSSQARSEETGRGAAGAESPWASRDVLDRPYAEAKRLALAAFDEAYLADVMRRAAGNAAEAARIAGLDRSNFRRLTRRPRDE